MGFSEGGPMTLLFAATYPQRTAAVVLFGSGASYVRADDYPWAPDEAEWRRRLAADGRAARRCVGERVRARLHGRAPRATGRTSGLRRPRSSPH